MQHPSREDWIPYLYNELSREDRQPLDQHLTQCPECREHLESWRRTQLAMRLYRLKRPVRTSSAWLRAALPWAAAAAIMLSIGFLLGRATGPALPDPAALRAQWEPGIRQMLEARLQEELSVKLEAVLAVAVSSSTNAANQHWAEQQQILQDARVEDQQAFLIAMKRLENQIAANYLSLRRDLETVASMAEREILQAQRGLTRLAAASHPEHPEN